MLTKNKNIRIMLVDDHKMMREGLRRILEEEKNLNVVAEVGDGEEAIEMARNNNIDLILMDINMPNIDGITATRVIKESSPSIYIIGLSIHSNEEVIKEMKRAGADAYIAKDQAVDSLISTIKKYLN